MADARTASTTETAKPSNQELAATIETWRERRYWTPDQWREVVGKENWPLAEAELNAAHNGAVDALVARVEALLAERDALAEEIRIREESQIPVIPRGAQAKMERLEGRVAVLEAAREPLLLAIETALAHAEALRMDTPEDESVREKLIETLRLALTASGAVCEICGEPGGIGEQHGDLELGRMDLSINGQTFAHAKCWRRDPECHQWTPLAGGDAAAEEKP